MLPHTLLQVVAACALPLLLAAVLASSTPVPGGKIGIYDFFTDESSPVIFNGKLLMFESIVEASPQWAGHTDPSFANCSSYFRVRDQSTGAVLVNMTETCNHAFGEAFVQTNGEGLDTLFVFGPAWVRMNGPSSSSSAPHTRTRRGVSWSGPCSDAATCHLDGWYTSDPHLQEWTTVLNVVRPGNVVFNHDIAHMGPPGLGARASPTPSPLGAFEWVLIWEAGSAGGSQFWASNSSDPTDAAGWYPLDPTLYGTDRFGNGQIGACPSLRYDPSTGYFYVLTGGQQLLALRSKTLEKGSWQLGANGGVFLSPDQKDCVLAPAPFGGWYSPSAEAQAHLSSCLSTPSGFGNDSDVDLTEVVLANGTVVTVLQYGSGDQKTFGFSNLAVYEGSMFEVLEGFF